MSVHEGHGEGEQEGDVPPRALTMKHMYRSYSYDLPTEPYVLFWSTFQTRLRGVTRHPIHPPLDQPLRREIC